MNKWRILLSKIYRFFYPIDLVTMYKMMGVKIGEGCKFQFDTVIDYSHYWLVEIGNNVTLAPRVHILAHDASTKRPLNYTRIAKVTIGDNVFIGAGTIILPGVTIGSNSIVGAGSIVSKDVLPNVIVSGNPANYICSVEEFLERHRNKMNSAPLFDESYTIRGGISEEKKVKMIFEIEQAENIGYVI